ncbi:LysR family transcriptional regulator [uncultured Marixanthomonas sp.]|uniref:LysR family transcriptional regulator n=1 Tax=uncultured Marixanthomonas sp. TaxID=757245 RepID=UPI0030D911DE|tara:strand:- start:99314 stop:100201 length:888 start_codon:yes stop_codon:yes gene_type:complete
MTFQQIRYFLVLAEELHFWRTAEKVFTSQSSLSRQIQSLENELGIQLFERDKRNVKLTEAGLFLQEKWTGLLDKIDRTHQHAKKIHDGTSGMISISYPGSIAFNFLPSLLNEVATALPELKVELQEVTDNTHETLLLNHQVDLAFTRDHIENPAIVSQQLYTEHVCLVVPEAHSLTESTFTNLKDTQHEKFIISGLHHTTYFASLLRHMFNVYGFSPNIHIESDFGGMILSLVAKGIGVSILPKSFLKAETKGVRFIELPEEVQLYVNSRAHDTNQVIQNALKITLNIGKEYKAI